MRKIDFFRKKYPKFVYEKFSWEISKNPHTRASTVRGRNLEIFFDFRVLPDIFFRPKITIQNIDKKRLAKIGDRELNNLIFHMGLMEIPSYWKATCSPEIEIKAGYLNKEQIKWWKDLIMNGMGQFFYENKIDFQKPNFLTILMNQAIAEFTSFEKELKRNRFLVPVGGGRDAIVTLELLKKRKKKIYPVRNQRFSNGVNAFLANPTKAARDVLKVAKIKEPIVIKRGIDPTLLKLNKKGYLNGHTPFTAVLFFLSVFCATLFDYKNIVFSLEKSADEGNVKYLGKMINHQWSKSSEFERKFKNYCKKYLTSDVKYFSLLRPYTELEISRMFLKYPQYFSVFSSCNVGLAEATRGRVVSKRGLASAKSYSEARWCGNCPKCLFVYATFYPFLEKKELLKIFGRDIFQNKKLLPIMKGLLGQGRVKPFECVGTKKESKLAFSWGLKKAQKTGETPYLLRKL